MRVRDYTSRAFTNPRNCGKIILEEKIMNKKEKLMEEIKYRSFACATITTR